MQRRFMVKLLVGIIVVSMILPLVSYFAIGR